MRFTWVQLDRLENLIGEDLERTTTVKGLEDRVERWTSATNVLDDLIYLPSRPKLVDAVGEEYTPTDTSDWRRFEMLLPKVKRILEKLVKAGVVEKRIDSIVNPNNRANRYMRVAKYRFKGKPS